MSRESGNNIQRTIDNGGLSVGVPWTRSISVVLITRNKPDIALSLSLLHMQLREGDELIVVDDHSNARHKQLLLGALRGDEVLVSPQGAGNRSRNRNLGARQSHGDILVFLDGDMVICENGLEQIRRAFATRPESAFVGSVHAMTFDEHAIRLYSGISDFVSEAKTAEGRRRICDDPLFAERRMIALDDGTLRKYYWCNFYSSVVAIGRAAFSDVGGFDESFRTWGSEDVELGYRLSKAGHQIGFVPDLHSIHLPHRRNVLVAERTNEENMRHAIELHHSWEWEVIVTFRETMKTVAVVDRMLGHMRHLDLPEMPVRKMPNTLYIDSVSLANHDGAITYFDDRCNETSLPMLGLCIPWLADQAMDDCYVSTNIFVYPTPFAAEVLREATRTSKRTHLVDSGNATRIDWQALLGEVRFAYRGRDGHFHHSIMEFDYRQNGNLIDVEHHAVP